MAIEGLALRVAAGSKSLRNEVRWVHVSELADPTPWLDGGELLLTTGLGVGELASTQRAYVRRLVEHGVAGLGFGVGFGFADVPEVVVEEANRREFPVLCIPFEVPFVAITRAVAEELAGEQLRQLRSALAVHERLAQAVVDERGLDSMLATVCNHLGCSLVLLDESGRVLAERHAQRRLPLDGALELPVVANGFTATLRAACAGGEFGEYDQLVLHHTQTALALELARRSAVSAAELRLAGDLLDDLEHDRLEEREASRRLAAFGLQPERAHAVLLAVPRGDVPVEQLRRRVAAELERRSVRYLSTVRGDRAAFVVEAPAEDDAIRIAREIARQEPDARLAVGRPVRGRAIGHSILEARAALEAGRDDLASYLDLGSLELLLSLPDAALAAFADRILGSVSDNRRLLSSLETLLACGCRWGEAADALGVHRHTLRHRMDRLKELTGLHPDEPEQRMELWLSIKALQALRARQDGALA